MPQDTEVQGRGRGGTGARVCLCLSGSVWRASTGKSSAMEKASCSG